MSLSKLGVFANMALAAGALLLPPTVTADDLGDDNAMEGLVINPLQRSVALDCPGCAVATKGEKGLSWTENAGNTLVCRPQTVACASFSFEARVQPHRHRLC